MQNDVIMAGFGGQGILLIGKMLAYAGMARGQGGLLAAVLRPGDARRHRATARSSSPTAGRLAGDPVTRAQLVAHEPARRSTSSSPTVRPGGLLVVNTSLINREPRRTDLKVVKVAANEIAKELGNPRGTNMVALGAYVGATGAVSLEGVEAVVRETFAGKPKIVDINIEALHRGHAIGLEHREA